MFGFKSKSVLGVDIGSHSIKIAELDVSRKGAQLVRFGVMPLQQGLVNVGEITDPVSIGGAIQSLVSNMRSKRELVVTGIMGSSVVVKKISMPKVDAQLVAEQIRWEAEQYIPFDINEVSLEHKILKTSMSSESMDILLVAAKQDLVFRYIEAIEVSQKKLAALDLSAFALANCFEFNYGVQPQTIGLLNLGASTTNFVVLHNGEIVFCKDIMIGGRHFTNDIMQTMNINFEESEALKLSASLRQEVPNEVQSQIKSTNEHYAEEIKQTIEFFSQASSDMMLSKLYVTGGSIYVPGLLNEISQVTQLPCEMMNPFNNITYNTKNLSSDYIDQIKSLCSVAIGLGLRQVGDS